MASNQHKNLWAEKLMQVSLPDSGEAWTSMEALLDKEGRGWKRDRRRWLLLALLLLLLIGVCNCPGRGRLFRGNTVVIVDRELKPPPAAGRMVPGPTPPVRQGVRSGGPTGRSGEPVAQSGGSTVTSSAGSAEIPSGGSAARPEGATVRPGGTTKAGPEGTTVRPKSKTVARLDGVKMRLDGSPPVAKAGRLVVGGLVVNGPVSWSFHRKKGADSVAASGPAKDSTNTPELAKNIPTKDSIRKPVKAPPALVKGPPAFVKTLPGKDSVRKKRPPPVEEEKQKEKENGWLAGIGLNQFFPLGGQQSAYNSSGTGGALSDYIPVPMIRYYFNRKLYIQLEAQINTPQATKKNLVITSPPPDTSTVLGSTIQHSASIQKLFYFNVPVSLHYEPFDNLDIGAGLQLSRLTNAVGTFDSTITNTISATTTNTKAVKSFKGDTLYQRIKTNELRFLVDVNYTYKYFILGLRYNEALSKFIHVEVAPGQVTQSRNSSLQLYVRYILWDGRKKKPVVTK